MDMADTAKRKPILAGLALNVAFLLAMFSVGLSGATFVLDVELSTLFWACGFAISSIGLVWFSWPRMPTRLRLLGFAVAGLAAMGGLFFGQRLLG
jgi:hypothetical protein